MHSAAGWLGLAAMTGVATALLRANNSPLSAKWLRQIDLLSRPKHSPLPGLDIARYSPEPQSHVERIDAVRGPKRKLADPMLFRMTSGAQRNGVAIARLRPDTTIGSGADMRGL